jgi:hypothetical protein
VLFLLLAISSAQAEIYKWTDGSGNIHYGDKPDAPQAKKMKQLPGLSTYAPPPVPEDKAASDNQFEADENAPAIEKKDAPAAPPFKYRELKIVSPEEGGTLRSSPGNISIFVAVAPVLRKGDYLKVTLDNTPLKDKYHSTVIQLQNVERGLHTVSVSVFDKEGEKMISSSSRTFQLHRTIAK